ncbi:hypothetical protein LUZ63_012970 [Rhynchospora breviuscula]|uniref:Uncharacterized protein n=1 Tax=Rhynchospora breviuscula TaxID=2022672 RepID=A0A9Q0HKG5_9POAL|nr:hypothetical protein LUZ63_012970 [Rhynchospora breviuscula]
MTRYTNEMSKNETEELKDKPMTGDHREKEKERVVSLSLEIPNSICESESLVDFSSLLSQQLIPLSLDFERGKGMCPLRIILIFLSATIAGFFVLRGLKTESEFDLNQEEVEEKNAKVDLPLSAKVRSAICGGFWTLVDMASGRYLWRTLVSPAASSEKKQ